MRLELEDSRRLTGPNLLWDEPGAILDVWVQGIEKEQVVICWQKQVERILDALHWPERTAYRKFDDGISLAISAPMDCLYSACEVAEYAWQLCLQEFKAEPAPDWDETIQRIRTELAEERNPALINIMQQAQQHNVTCVSDDDFCSLGMGSNVDVIEIKQLPKTEAINWRKYHNVPLAFITGTNGKSTSVRLAAEIAKAAQMRAGVTSTDFIRVGDDIIDTGDYSGPGGARMLIRDKRTEIAFLEVARGGILRRGLPVPRVDAGLITNVAADHLGQYGINTVEELAEAKFVIAKGIAKSGTLVLNADNELVVKQGSKLDCHICWYSENKNQPQVKQHRESKQPAVYLDEDTFIYFNGESEQEICTINDVPITFAGTARHNIQNALGVIGLCFALGIDQTAIAQGLRAFGKRPEDNPGRGNLYNHRGGKIIVDFAHNEHSMRAVIAMAKKLPAQQRIVMFSHAGDRSDTEMQQLTNAVADLQADVYIPAEVSRYLRGREPMQVPALSKTFLLDAGIDASKIELAESPLEGCEKALTLMQQGAMVLLFTLDQRAEVQALIERTT
ncbi:MAG: Mur ligase family protein [Aestuariibacter sp.]